ncbi:hypothetical protein [Nocardioides speluncae]|uniref:hypothetical protein n=1 Tax=Nocardioides speluncae TaxID=2670337 RepID=UPI000D68B580|nr:hypothetical protein [Nocardioides speluncae]
MSDRDPIRDLENFSLEGDPVHPLPASEVRRRGDRLRRRRQGLVAVAAAAAVAVIATSTVVAAQNLTGGDTQPAPEPSPSPDWLDRIPDDFPLAQGWPKPGLSGGGESTSVPGRVVGPDRNVDPLRLYACADEVGVANPADRLTAAIEQFEFRMREVRLFADDTTAQAHLDSMREAYQACPRQDTGGGTASLHQVNDLDGGEDAFEVETTYDDNGDPANSLRVLHVVRVGNAVFLDDGSSSDQDIDVHQLAAEHRAQLDPPLGAMCVFAAEPCAQEAPSSEPPGDARTDIPKDFPIGVDLEATDADSEIIGPSATARGVNELDLCGTSLRPSGHVGRLATTYTAPEYADSRELVTFPSVDAAVDYLAGLRAAVSDCPDTGQGRTITPLEADTGYDDSVTFALSDQEQGLGAETYQVVRVGNAVLLTDESTHGTLDSARRDLPVRTALAGKLIPHMCVFTEAGC